MAEANTQLNSPERPAGSPEPPVEHSSAHELPNSSPVFGHSTATPVAPAVTAAPITTEPTPQAMADELVEEIEDILEDDLDKVYEQMPPAVQASFRQEGEKTAVDIQGIVSKFHFTARAVFRRIASWLRLIPGVNKFFLEQEAKIKTDEIVELVEKEQADRAPKM